MGLALVHGLVASHEGAITVASVPGQGATFEVYLPRIRKSPAVTTEFVGDSLVADVFPAVSDSGCAIRVRLKRPTSPLGFLLEAADGNPDRIVVDVPLPHEVFFYLVRAENTCGEGILGVMSNGTPHVGGPCP
jgi:hypothetical protein